MSDRYRKIVFLETQYAVDEYAKNNGSCANGELRVAMKPSVRAYAKKQGIFCESTIGYLPSEKHAELSLKGKKMADWIRRNANLVDTEFKVATGYLNTMTLCLKYAINYCLFAIEVISASHVLHNPETLCVASKKGRKPSRKYITPLTTLFIQPEEGILSSLAKSFAENNGLVFEDLSQVKDVPDRGAFFSNSIKRLLSLALLIFLYTAYRLERTLIVLKNKLMRKRNVFFTTKTGYMRSLAEILRKEKSLNLYFLRESLIPAFDNLGFAKLFFRKWSKPLARQKDLFLKFAEEIADEKELFSHKGVSFAQIIANKFRKDIMPYIIGLNIWTVELDKIIGNLQPRLVLSSGNRTDDVITGELCQRMNIPALFISHGSFVYPKNEVERAEWGELGSNLLRVPYSFIALQTPLSEGYLEVFPPTGKPVKTGPLIWGKRINLEKSRLLFDKIFNGRYRFKEDVKIILHAGTAKPSHSLRLHIYETPDEYIQSLTDLTSAIKGIPDAILIIRFRPFPEVSIDDLKTLVPFSERIILSTDGPFNDMLGMADLLVSFSSTTIEEALQNRIPVLFYGGGGRYQHVPAYEVTRDNSVEPSAVYCIKEAGDLSGGLKKILSLNLCNPEFNRLFNRYIYAEKDRTALLSLIKDLQESSLKSKNANY